MTGSALQLRRLPRSFFARPVLDVAPDLIGCVLAHVTDEGRVAGRIVEAEAYGADDPGSHAARGRTERNAPMFEKPGLAYVYFTYGMHFCFNIVTDEPGRAGAVLVRAVEPLDGIELMRARRGAGIRDRDLARGPGRLTQAFGIGREHNRADLTKPPLLVYAGERFPSSAVVRTPRIGLGAVQDGRPWRFALRASPWVSGPRAPTPLPAAPRARVSKRAR